MTDAQSYNSAPSHATSVRHVVKIQSIFVSYNLKCTLRGGNGITSLPVTSFMQDLGRIYISNFACCMAQLFCC